MAFVTPNGWHFRVVDLISAFGPSNVAFWGFETFLSRLQQALVERSRQGQPPTLDYVVNIGFLQLSVLSTVNHVPVTWDKLIWFAQLLRRMVQNGNWTGVEFDAYIWDEMTGETVWIALRILLDAPLRRIGA